MLRGVNEGADFHKTLGSPPPPPPPAAALRFTSPRSRRASQNSLSLRQRPQIPYQRISTPWLPQTEPFLPLSTSWRTFLDCSAGNGGGVCAASSVLAKRFVAAGESVQCGWPPGCEKDVMDIHHNPKPLTCENFKRLIWCTGHLRRAHD